MIWQKAAILLFPSITGLVESLLGPFVKAFCYNLSQTSDSSDQYKAYEELDVGQIMKLTDWKAEK